MTRIYLTSDLVRQNQKMVWSHIAQAMMPTPDQKNRYQTSDKFSQYILATMMVSNRIHIYEDSPTGEFGERHSWKSVSNEMIFSLQHRIPPKTILRLLAEGGPAVEAISEVALKQAILTRTMKNLLG